MIRIISQAYPILIGKSFVNNLSFMIYNQIDHENLIIEKITTILATKDKPMTIQRLQNQVKIPYLNLISLLNTMHTRDMIDMYNPKRNRSNVNLKYKTRTLEFCPQCYGIIYKRNDEDNTLICEDCDLEFEVNSPLF